MDFGPHIMSDKLARAPVEEVKGSKLQFQKLPSDKPAKSCRARDQGQPLGRRWPTLRRKVTVPPCAAREPGQQGRQGLTGAGEAWDRRSEDSIGGPTSESCHEPDMRSGNPGGQHKAATDTRIGQVLDAAGEQVHLAQRVWLRAPLPLEAELGSLTDGRRAQRSG